MPPFISQEEWDEHLRRRNGWAEGHGSIHIVSEIAGKETLMRADKVLPLLEDGYRLGLYHLRASDEATKA